MPAPNPLLNLLPLETERLKIRRYQELDFEAARAINQDPEVRHWIPSGVLSERRHREYHANCCGEAATGFITEDRQTGELIGEMTFRAWQVDRTWEVGWLILPGQQGRGYATEAAHALLELGFGPMNLHRIVAMAQPQNTASWRVMEKLGMRREADHRQCIPRPDGSWWDEVIYAVLAAEWGRVKA